MDFETLAVIDDPSLFPSQDFKDSILAACRMESLLASTEPLHGKYCFLLPLSGDDSTFVLMTRRVYENSDSIHFLEVLRSARRGGASFAMIMVPAA